MERLVKNGWGCTVVDFNQQTGEKLVEKFGDQIIFVRANVARWDDLAGAFEQTWEKWGRLDLGM